MHKILHIFFILILIHTTQCYPQVDSLSKFNHEKYNLFIPSKPERGKIVTKAADCDGFKYNLSENYFVDEMVKPYLTTSDIDKMVDYGIRSQQIKSLINKNDTLKRGLLYLLPRIRNIIDTAFYDLLILYEKDYSYKSLDKSQVYDLISSDAVILGQVIDKKYILDSSRCFLYKTEYIVKVNEVLHSYFELNNGDNVLLKSTLGLEGGCNTSNPILLGITNHGNEYQIGDKWIFF